MSHDVHERSLPRGRIVTAAIAATIIAVSVSAWAIMTDLAEIALVHEPNATHADQSVLNNGSDEERFEEAFELGDELFATSFNALDGGGANVGAGHALYTRRRGSISMEPASG